MSGASFKSKDSTTAPLANKSLITSNHDVIPAWRGSVLFQQSRISSQKPGKLQAKSKSNNHSRKIHEVSAPRSLNHPIIPQYPSNPCPPVTVTRCSTAMLYALLLSWAAVCQTLSHMICHHITIATCIFFHQKMCCNLWNTTLDGRVTQRLEVDLQCDCGLSSPDREHFTFFCDANPWHGDLKTPTERRLLVPLVDAPAVLPFEDMTADPILVAFLQQFDPHQTPTLGLDGSCAIAPGCELWQRASWAVAAHLGPTVNGLVHGFEQTPAAGERGALLQACLASHEANRAVRLLIDNQALVQRLHRGMRLGQWGGDLFPYWHYIRMLLVDGSSCAWIPSHDKAPRWRPPEGWLDVLRCRMLNAKADASAADLTGQFRQVTATCLSQHREAVVWAGEAWKAQLKGSLPYWQVLLEHEPRQNRSFEWAFAASSAAWVVLFLTELALRLVQCKELRLSDGNFGVLTTSLRWGAGWRPPPIQSKHYSARAWCLRQRGPKEKSLAQQLTPNDCVADQSEIGQEILQRSTEYIWPKQVLFNCHLKRSAFWLSWISVPYYLESVHHLAQTIATQSPAALFFFDPRQVQCAQCFPPHSQP